MLPSNFSFVLLDSFFWRCVQIGFLFFCRTGQRSIQRCGVGKWSEWEIDTPDRPTARPVRSNVQNIGGVRQRVVLRRHRLETKSFVLFSETQYSLCELFMCVAVTRMWHRRHTFVDGGKKH